MLLKAVASLCIGLALAGCAGTQPGHSRTTPERLLAVPFFPDGSDQCGPATLASVLMFWGHPVEPSVLKKEIYVTRLKGSLSLDLLIAAQRRGLEARLYSGSLDNAKAELTQGHPLIAFLNRGFELVPLGHYVVLTGFDDVRQGFFMHSGHTREQFVSYKAFLRNWNKTQRSTLLVLPPRQGKGQPSAHGPH